jgi:hypothetical protein
MAVFLLHSLRFFDPFPWHVKNPITYRVMEPAGLFFTTWVMPLIFVISGASTYYALGKYRAGPFLRERALRLLVPLVVGIFSHVAWQVYLERVTYRRFSGSFFHFLPHYFDGFYESGGNFPFMGLHLWYLELLFLFSLILLPLLVWLRRGSGRGFLSWLGERLAFPGAVYLLALLAIPPAVLPNPATPLGAQNFGGWNALVYIPIFCNGFLVVSQARLYEQVRRLRWLSLVGSILLIGWLLALVGRTGVPVYGTPRYAVLWGLRCLDAWLLVLAILGFAAQHLRFPVAFLGYANEAVLPFYVMHQTVLLTVGYYVVRWPIPDPLKWLLIMSLSLAICLVLYEFLVRRFNLLRFLFGLRPLSKATAVHPTEATGSLSAG